MQAIPYNDDLMLPHITAIITQDQYARYELEPFERGYGRTVGTALQHVMQFSLPGAAVTSLSIQGVRTQHDVLPGVEETVEELALNVKLLRLRVISELPVSLRLDARGAREGTRKVRASDLMAPPTIELINPDLHLATLTDEDAHLVMDLVAEQGRGYRPAGASEGELDRPGVIALDAIFTPIPRVQTKIENTRVGQITTYEKLILEVWTDGTIDPDEALRQAGDILVRAFTPFLMVSGFTLPAVESVQPVGHMVQVPPEIARQSIEDLDLSVRTYNALKRNGIITLGRLLEMTEEELRALRNVGDRSLRELQERLVEHDALPGSQHQAQDSAEV